MINKGDRIPEVNLVKATENGPEQVSSSDYFAGKKSPCSPCRAPIRQLAQPSICPVMWKRPPT